MSGHELLLLVAGVVIGFWIGVGVAIGWLEYMYRKTGGRR